MKTFTLQNFIIAIVTLVIFILLTTVIFYVHRKFLKKIKSWQAAPFFRSNVDYEKVNVIDNRNRVFMADEGISLTLDPTMNYRDSFYGHDENLTLLTFVPKKKPLYSRRVLRVIYTVIFAFAVVITFLSAGLLISEFFEKDVIEALNIVYTKEFWNFIKSYDVLFISFTLSLFTFLMNRLLSDTISTFKKYEIAYINMLNYQQLTLTYTPVVIRID